MKINFKLTVLGMILLPVYSAVCAQQWQYLVKPGDTLWSIAEEYLISETYSNQLQQFNSIKEPLVLQPGTTITAPVEWLGNLPGSVYIVSIIGNVEAVRGNQTLQVNVGFDIEADDEIITGETGVAILKFSDQSILSVYSNTQLTFKKLKQSFDGSIVNARLSVESGRIKVEGSPEKKQGQRLEIESPAAVTAVRGTVFRVGVEKGHGDTVTEVLSGKVAVSALDKDISLQKHYGTKTKPGKVPINPVKLLQAPEIIIEDKIESKIGKLTWNKVDKAQIYRVRVASDIDLTKIIYDELASSTQANDIFFSEDGDFYTSVRAIDSNNIEGIDAIAKLTVNARPEPPLILGPKDNTSSFNGHPVFSWAIPADSTTQMHYQLSNNDQFDPLLIDEVIELTDSFTPESLLLPGEYYWRIANLDESGRGPFSASSILTIKEQPTLAPEIQESGSSVSLSLSKDPSVSSYHIQVSRDAQFRNILHEEWSDGDEFTFNTEGSGKYYIRLGINASESSSDIQYSDAQKIIVPFNDWKQLMITLATGLLIVL